MRPRGVLRLMSPPVARMGERQERTIWSALKRHLEAHGTSFPASV
jgi:hypothetical protein